MIRIPAALSIDPKQLRRLFPVVLNGRHQLFILLEVFFLFPILLLSLADGEAPSGIIKSTVIIPSMLLVVLCTCDLVPSLRKSGDLELIITLPRPEGMILHRLLPVLSIVAAQTVLISVILAFTYVNPWRALIGLIATIIPVAMSTTAGLYWNFRFKGAGTVFVATLATVLPAILWISSAPLVRESENVRLISSTKLLISTFLSQAGILMAAVCLAALAFRRLNRPEKWLEGQ